MSVAALQRLRKPEPFPATAWTAQRDPKPAAQVSRQPVSETPSGVDKLRETGPGPGSATTRKLGAGIRLDDLHR